VKVKNRHFRRAKCLNSVAYIDIFSIRSDLHRSVEGFCHILRVFDVRLSRNLSRRGNSLRRAHLEALKLLLLIADEHWSRRYWNG